MYLQKNLQKYLPNFAQNEMPPQDEILHKKEVPFKKLKSVTFTTLQQTGTTMKPGATPDNDTYTPQNER